MHRVIRILPVLAVGALAACDSRDQTRDFGLNSHPLDEMQAGIWIDPNGCDHWIIDDGIEGYMSQRLDRQGRPVCSGDAEPGQAVWDYVGENQIVDGFF